MKYRWSRSKRHVIRPAFSSSHTGPGSVGARAINDHRVPQLCSLASLARTMFSVEPRDQSARTTTLRFACARQRKEKHRIVSQSRRVLVVSQSRIHPPTHRDSFLSRTARTPRDLLRPETAA